MRYKTFWLGTHKPHWLRLVDVPLCVSFRQLRLVRRLPRARARWVLDSGAFTEIKTYGEWTVSPSAYAGSARRYAEEVGRLEWAAIQDWMCEEDLLERTGLSVRRHQELTVRSYYTLKDLAPEVPWLPVLQGWTPGQYLDCVELYDLGGRQWREGPVGVGSICRRQGTTRTVQLLQRLADEGLRLHGFGLKQTGLERGARDSCESSDSLAWSYHAFRHPEEVGTDACRATHKNCANCLPYALGWRDRLLERVGRRDAA